MNTYDVYIRDRKGETIIKQLDSWNPDDAIDRARVKGDYIPEHGDRITRCVVVNCPPSPGRNGTRP